ncbi:DUF917 domain-containing protein [Streptomyces inhibens]|uniref:DUF917 domain-containing protein n=1 Tax=Streptomyces inhibens TaxID=2293571 RepID=UPI00379E0973
MTPQTPVDAYLDAEDVDALAEGSTVLAEGSEESALAVARDWARAAVRERGRVPLLAPSRLPADLACATVTLVGSSAALAEQLPSGREAASALEAFTRCTGRRPDALVALNSAAENAMLAAAAAADSGTSLVDGDACGRVFPLLEQTTFTLDGHAPLPLAMTTSTGDVVVIEHAGTRIENLVRPLVMAAGGWALVVCYPMPGDAVARGAVPGSFTRLLTAGRATGAARFAPWRPRALCRGRITAVEHPEHALARGLAGFTGRQGALPSRRTSVVVTETEGLRRHVRLEAQNEILLVLADGAVIAESPDQILTLSAADRRVLGVEHLAPGVQVEVVAIDAHPAWHTPEGLALAAEGEVPGPTSPARSAGPTRGTRR